MSAGTLGKATIDGVTYSIKGGADGAKMPNKFENKPLVSTGGNMQQKVLRSQTINGIDLQCTTTELEALKATANRTDSYPLSITYPDGSVYRTVGFINLGEYKNMEATVPVDFSPGRSNEWEHFA